MLRNEEKLSFTLFGQMKPGTLSRGKTIQSGVRANKVVEKDEHGNEVVGRSKGRKALFGLVPCFELLVKALNKVVGDVVVKTLDTDVLDIKQCFDGHLVGKIAVTNNGSWRSQRFYGFQNGESLWAVPVAVKMETKDKASLTVENEP